MKLRVTITSRTHGITVGEPVTLIKEPENTSDSEAIAVLFDSGLNAVKDGYVAATYKTRLARTVSAGRIYDRFGDSISGTVVSSKVVEIEVPAIVTHETNS